MKLDKPSCAQCGAKAIGTVDTLYATALFIDLSDEGEAEYSGSSDVHWDTQETVDEAGGLKKVTCGSHEWFTIIFEEEQ